MNFLDTRWNEIVYMPPGYVPEPNHALIFYANYAGNNSDLNYYITWQNLQAILGGGPASVTASAPLTGNGLLASPLSIQNGTAVNDILQWNGAAWVIQQPNTSGITSFPLTGNGTLATPTTVTNGLVAGNILQWNGVAWILTQKINYLLVTPTDNQVSFTLPTVPLTSNSVQMFVNGAKMAMGTDYTLIGNVITYNPLNYQINTIDSVEFYY